MAKAALKAAVLVCMLAGAFAVTKTSTYAPTPSSVTTKSQTDNTEWVIAAGPDPSKKVKPGKIVEDRMKILQQLVQQIEIPPFPVTATSNTTSNASQAVSGGKVVFSSAQTNLNATDKGMAFGWSYSKASAQNGVNTCGRAVANAFTNTCGKGNAVVAISAAAESCANAVAKIYVDSIAKVNSTDGANACATSTAIATVTANAVAAAISNVLATALTPCASAAAFAQSQAFTAALVNVSTQAASKACSLGKGAAWTQGTGMAQAMAYGYAKILMQAAAKACACSNCGCQLPPSYMTDTAFSNAVGAYASGKYAVLSAVGNAGALFCLGGSMQVCVQQVIDSLVRVYANVLTQLDTEAHTDGNAFACTQVTGKGNVSAIASAMGETLAGALSLNFEHACGMAVTASAANAVVNNTAAAITDAISTACSRPRVYTQCYTDAYTQKQVCVELIGSTETTTSSVTNQLTSSPVAKAIANVLSNVKNQCQCKGSCWCGNGAKCSPHKTCPAFTVVPPTYKPPCTGYGCPSPAPHPSPSPPPGTPSPSPSPCTGYNCGKNPTPAPPSNPGIWYNVNTKPL